MKMNLKMKLSGIATGLLAAIALTAGLSAAQAQPYDHGDRRWDCRQQVERAEMRLDRAINRHGRQSWEARQRRHELMQARDRCWRRDHRWWDPRDHRWHDRHW